MHGGLNTFHFRGQYKISELNAISRKYNGIVPIEENIKNDRDRPVLSSINSPYWDRRLNFEWKYQLIFKLNGIDAKATTQSQLDSILVFYNSSRLIIGHSVVDDVRSDFTNKVIKIDVKHGRNVNSGKIKGLLIENNSLYGIDDNSHKNKL